MTTLREQYKNLAIQMKKETLENYCQKVIDKFVKEIWKNEKYYLEQFKQLIFQDKEPTIYINSQLLYVNNQICVSIKKPNTFFEYYSYHAWFMVECLRKIISDSKLPKDILLNAKYDYCYVQIFITLR